MSDGEAIVQKVDSVFTKEALKENDGKVVPLRSKPGGPVIGEATLKFDEEELVLKATFNVDDPKIAELFRSPPHPYF